MSMKVLIQKEGDEYFEPTIEEGVQLSQERDCQPDKLTFSVIPDKELTNYETNELQDLAFYEGDKVLLQDNKDILFIGYIFSKERSKDNIIKVTAYDQIRYLKNKDTLVYSDKTATELVQLIADRYNLSVSDDMDDSGFKIEYRLEDNTSLLDMISNAIDLTYVRSGEAFVFYDDVGKLTLKSFESMIMTDYVVQEDTAEDISYSSSIDKESYNKIKLVYTNNETNETEPYVVQDDDNIEAWGGILQMYKSVDSTDNIDVLAKAYLNRYDYKTRSLSIKNALGDTRIRGGSLIPVIMTIGDLVLSNLMIVDKVTHTFKEDDYRMDLTLIGDDIVE